MAEWKPINDLFDFEKGTLQSSKCRAGEFTFVTAAEEWKTHESYTHDCEALIFAMAASGSLGRTHYINGKFIASDLCFILTPRKGLKLDMMFYYRLFNFLRSDIVKKTSTGTSKLAINQTNFGAYQLPYFDYEHQLVFRDKIERISEISQGFDAGLNDQLTLLKQLRQSILQEAVEGRLTADWRKKNTDLITGNNHASELLETIKAEKERLIDEGKIRKEKPITDISEKEELFALPEGWVWCRVGNLGTIERGVSPEYGSISEYKILNQKCVRWGHIITDWAKPVLSDWWKRLNKSCLTATDDILVNSTGEGTIGRSGLITSESEGLPFDTHVLRIRLLCKIAPKFIVFFINSRYGQDQVIELKGAKTTKQTELGVVNLCSFVFPLPPIGEQSAIVERVENIMAMIDGIEEQVSERKGQSESLMRSVLSEAFTVGV